MRESKGHARSEGKELLPFLLERQIPPLPPLQIQTPATQAYCHMTWSHLEKNRNLTVYIFQGELTEFVRLIVDTERTTTSNLELKPFANGKALV